MYQFKKLEEVFESYSTRIKVELVLLPLILFLLISIFLIKNFETFEKEINYDFSNIEMQKYIETIIMDIEEYLINKKIAVNHIRKDEQKIYISLFAGLQEQVNFIKYIENYNSFSNVIYVQKSKNELDLVVSFERLLFKNKQVGKLTIDNGFKQTHKNISFHLSAIFANKALINNRWFYEKQIINSMKIEKIGNSYVLLSNGKKVIKLRLHNSEKF